MVLGSSRMVHIFFFSLKESLVLAVKRKDGLLLLFMYDTILQLTAGCMQTLVDAQGGVHYLNAKFKQSQLSRISWPRSH